MRAPRAGESVGSGDGTLRSVCFGNCVCVHFLRGVGARRWVPSSHYHAVGCLLGCDSQRWFGSRIYVVGPKCIVCVDGGCCGCVRGCDWQRSDCCIGIAFRCGISGDGSLGPIIGYRIAGIGGWGVCHAVFVLRSRFWSCGWCLHGGECAAKIQRCQVGALERGCCVVVGSKDLASQLHKHGLRIFCRIYEWVCQCCFRCASSWCRSCECALGVDWGRSGLCSGLQWIIIGQAFAFCCQWGVRCLHCSFCRCQ
mmetsp:Transcript_62044/g.133822  ORF Transcript_62044/g.133822 Transcript_62044/m.133822 type:complete len:253 (+) Transcript_62044:229-987(+)